ncbi:NAD-dependent epimerase/dehydratase family protein [Herbidospora galbida]|uniref:NAD-dependent epimerase/dehydratase family protein n=1 Tax=Herbidospora galbida TaxID=2575442 RepID=A0A4U3MPY6_9ACTN|nr:NAD(P)H-binding protein [Herbidospora galbida]TKK91711.1 NAD-dependent epimerase/dehydratase family protein [Herbidospora galbida]
MTFLVTGATGRAGRHVVDALLAEGHRVRALTRHPGRAAFPPQVEVAGGDLTDPESLRGALRGVVGVHLLTTGGDDYATLTTGPELAALFAEAGVRRVTLLWNGRVGPVEEAFAAGSVEWTRLEATDFMSNTLQWLPQIERGRVEEMRGDVPVAVVHEADVGAVAARVLMDGGHAGRSYTITGPVALTVRDRLAAIGKVLGRRLEFAELGEERARESWRAAGHGEELVEIFTAWHGTPHPATPVVRELLGRRPLTFEQWLATSFAGR